MLEEIARNKRRSVAVIVLFVAIWLGIGAGYLALGTMSSALTTSQLSAAMLSAMLLIGL